MERDISRIHVVHFINEVPRVGAPLHDWPGHVTVVPPFELANSLGIDDVISTVESASENTKDLITLEPGDHEFFGPETEVVKIRNDESLRKLHFDLVHALENLGIVFTDKRWMLEGYNPHSTIIGGVEMAEPKICDSLSINMKRLGQKVVARTIKLGDTTF